MNGMKKTTIIIAMMLFSLGGFWCPLQSQELTGPPLPVDPRFKPRLGTYFYRFDFNNMNIGTATVAIDREGDLYKVKVLAQTNSTIDRIYKIRYRGESIMDTSPSITTIQTKTQQQVKSVEKDITMKFQQNGDIKTIEKKSEDGDTVEYEVREYQPEKFTVDPFAATYLVRGLEWSVGKDQVFDVYGGKRPYELRLRCDRMESFDAGGIRRNVWVIIPTVRKFDENGQEIPPKKKPAQTKIYLSADEFKDVLKIESSHSMGYFRVTLDRFEAAISPVKATVPDKGAAPAPN